MAAPEPFQEPEGRPIQPPPQVRPSPNAPNATALPMSHEGGTPAASHQPAPPPQQRLDSQTEADSTEAAEESELSDAAEVVLRSSPAWLASMVFHLLLMIVMGMIVYVNLPRKPIELNAETVFAEKQGDQLLFDAPGLPDVKTTADELAITPDDLPPVEDPLAAPSRIADIRPEGMTAVSDLRAPEFGLALSGRQEGSSLKQGLISRYGGSEITEGAVRRGLAWLARNQQRDGSWSLAAPFSGGVQRDLDNQASATAMALIAFQGAGNTHQQGEFKSNVARGWRWLLRQQDADGCFLPSGLANHRFYTQGQCLIAICELFGMTQDTLYKSPAQRGVNYCLRCQGADGGWRYYPNEVPSDVSVTGWVVMGLQSARMAGLSVAPDSLYKVGHFLDSVAQYEGARYPYQRGGEVRRSMTAEALLMREYLGWKRNDPRLVAGMAWLTSRENLIDFRDGNRDAYYWYYATQAAHHIEGDYWKRWNAVMRQALPQHQVLHGRESGSWDPDKPEPDQWASFGGRLYVTCLSIYMLEVYYRHLPLYSSVYAGAPPPPAPADPESPPPKQEPPAEKPVIEGVN